MTKKGRGLTPRPFLLIGEFVLRIGFFGIVLTFSSYAIASYRTMKSSFYNLLFPGEDAVRVFNTHRGTLCDVPVEVATMLRQEGIPEIDPEISDALAALGMLVDDDADEVAEYLGRYEASKNRSGALSVILFMATSCNLGCPYCYQSAPSKPGNVIRKEALDRFVSWVKWEIDNNAITSLELKFYGGEPLLARLLMPAFIASLNRVCSEGGIPVVYDIVTNATLFDEPLIRLFVENSIRMQITLDGSGETHDKRRAWKGTGKGSFDEIFANLEQIASLGGAHLVNLRMNVDQENITEVGELAGRARALGIGTFTCGRIHFREKQTEYQDKTVSSQSFEDTFDLEIFRILAPLGYSDSPSNLESRDTCLYHWKRGFAVSPALDLFKCDELIDHPEFRVGSISENGVPVMNEIEYEKAVSRKPTDFESCTSCRYLPQCGSGCSIRALNAKGTPHVNFCEATYESVRRKVNSYAIAAAEGLIPEDSSSKCGSCHCGT